MRGTMWLMALGCGILLSTSGCCGFPGEGNCGRGCGCGSYSRCEGDCGPTCGPARRAYRERVEGDDCGGCSTCGARAACGGQCSACGDECGSSCQRNFCFHPLRALGKLFYAGTWCGPCCGNTYWGECISDPPACHDPCSRDGHYASRSGGCASCNRGGMHEGGEMSTIPEGATLQDEPAMEPTPAKAPTKATRKVPAVNYDR